MDTQEVSPQTPYQRRRNFLLLRIDRDRTQVMRLDEIARRSRQAHEAGPGHAWTDTKPVPTMQQVDARAAHLTDLVANPHEAAWKALLQTPGQVPYPSCRHCGAIQSSAKGLRPCPGDEHRCPAPEENGFQQGGHPLTCGVPGSFDRAFHAWTCTAGHVTSTQHDSQHGGRSCDRVGCPCPYLKP